MAVWTQFKSDKYTTLKANLCSSYAVSLIKRKRPLDLFGSIF